jgi:ribosomal protein S18 acetylase RimI-like enzyme
MEEGLACSVVRDIRAGEEDRAVDAIVLAFATDPTARWTWPVLQQYLAAMPRLVRAFGGNAFARGSACCTEDFEGAALWLPPGVHPDEEKLADELQSTLSPPHRDDVMSTFEQMAAYHPSEPHWYLPLIGTDPTKQGRGYGSALLRHALARCDRDKLPAYLESSNPANVPLYGRHGFEVIGSIQQGSSPELVPMLRKPR